ncbi:MAG: hypothetical protein H6861_01665 [Rhodospirillales bacterium]|nr:hypothetical protein [Rhodospirillales bacterium]
MSKTTKMPEFFINAFYESKFKDNFFVIKVGGKIIEDDEVLENLLSNIRDLTLQGIKILLIYGGGRAMDEEAAKRGIEVQKIGGRRVTDAANMEIARHVLGGDLSLKVTGMMSKIKLEGLSFNCVPPSWMRVALKPKIKGDDFAGSIEDVYARPINRLFRSVNFVACSCLAQTRDGITCNINADTIATQIAIGTRAHKLIFLSDIDGVKIGGRTAEIITAEQIEGYIADGTATGGMQVKLENCKAALDAGVRRIHLLSGLREDALKKEIYEPVGPGTMLFKENERQSYENEVQAHKLIAGQKG